MTDIQRDRLLRAALGFLALEPRRLVIGLPAMILENDCVNDFQRRGYERLPSERGRVNGKAKAEARDGRYSDCRLARGQCLGRGLRD